MQIDTTNILFICGGAFEGIEESIERRLNQKSLGFRASAPEQARPARRATCWPTSCPKTCCVRPDPRVHRAAARGRPPCAPWTTAPWCRF